MILDVLKRIIPDLFKENQGAKDIFLHSPILYQSRYKNAPQGLYEVLREFNGSFDSQSEGGSL